MTFLMIRHVINKQTISFGYFSVTLPVCYMHTSVGGDKKLGASQIAYLCTIL